jgi:hypothetical protein
VPTPRRGCSTSTPRPAWPGSGCSGRAPSPWSAARPPTTSCRPAS